jgi:hypothetical protein
MSQDTIASQFDLNQIISVIILLGVVYFFFSVTLDKIENEKTIWKRINDMPDKLLNKEFLKHTRNQNDMKNCSRDEKRKYMSYAYDPYLNCMPREF